MPNNLAWIPLFRKSLRNLELTMTMNYDAYYQYSDGRDILSMTLIQRENLLRELKALADAPQGNGGSETITEFDLLRAQELLYELSLLAEKIISLAVQINCYAETIGKPCIHITSANST